MNPAARALLTLSDSASPEGQAIEITFAHLPEFLAFLSKALRARTPIDRGEIRLAGTPAMILGVTVTPLSKPDGTCGGVVALFKDLTQIERGEEQAALKERLAALGQMAAGLAHEMRNPLASIKVTVGLLRKAYPNDPDLDRKLGSIFTEVQRLNQTVTDCLAFARPIGFEPRCVRIEHIIEKILNQVISLEHTYPFSVVRRFNQTPEAWLDPQQMEIVFFNIINNAIDAMRQRHGTITITTNAEQHVNPCLVVTVSDTGEGIPSERIPMLFTPFFTTKGKGSGLGLANAKKIIDHLQGNIEVTTEMGKGTTFTVRVPFAEPMKLAS